MFYASYENLFPRYNKIPIREPHGCTNKELIIYVNPTHAISWLESLKLKTSLWIKREAEVCWNQMGSNQADLIDLYLKRGLLVWNTFGMNRFQYQPKSLPSVLWTQEFKVRTMLEEKPSLPTETAFTVTTLISFPALWEHAALGQRTFRQVKTPTFKLRTERRRNGLILCSHCSQ